MRSQSLAASARWRVYAPRSEEEVLRRDCSPDYSQEDIGDPVLEVELQPGVHLLLARELKFLSGCK